MPAEKLLIMRSIFCRLPLFSVRCAVSSAGRGVLPALLLAGCAGTPHPVIRPLNQPAGPDARATPRVNGALGALEGYHRPVVAYGDSVPVAVPSDSPLAHDGTTMLDFADTDIRDVTAQILGRLLKVNYVVAPSVKGTVTLHTETPLSADQIIPTFQALLAQVGATLYEQDGVYRVMPMAQAGAGGHGGPMAALAGARSLAGSSMVPLRYASAEDLAKVLAPFVGAGAHITAVPGPNAVLVTGEPQIRETVRALVRAFDIDALRGQSYALLPIDSGGAKDFAHALSEALKGKGHGLSQMVRVIPMTRVDAVLVVASQRRYVDDARRLFNVIEAGRRATVRSWHVYYLQNTHANDAANLLQQAFTPDNVTAQPTQDVKLSGLASGGGMGGGTGGAMSGQQSGGLGGMQSGSGSMGGLGTSGSGGSNGLSSGLAGGMSGQSAGTSGGGAAPAMSADNPLLGGLDSGHADKNAMRIIPNRHTNALLIYATEKENDTVENMLHKIDILPLQVRIDATIAEVNLNDALQYGTQFFFKSGGINGVLSNNSQTITTATLASAAFSSSLPGFIIGGASGGGAPFAISALQAVTDVHILSSPQLMVLDNETARLQVGQLVPYQTGSQSSLISSGSVYNSVSYQPTGVIMKVTPRVNSGGLVTLDIAQEVSSVDSSVTTSGLNSPTFNERSVNSRIVIQDGQTVGIAGLIEDKHSRGNSGIPWLKNIPVLGLLGSTQDNTHTRTELLVLITPHVVHDQRGAQALTEDMRASMINAAGVPLESARSVRNGNADPGRGVRRALKLDD